MNSNATAAVDNITQSSVDDTLTVNALGQVNTGDFFDGAAGTDTINVSYVLNGSDFVDFRLATVQNYEALTFINPGASALGNFNVHFSAAQFGSGAGTNSLNMAFTGANGSQTVFIHNAHNFTSDDFTFANWTSGSDWLQYVGSSAADTLYGSQVGDKLEGGDNDDVYYVNNSKDTVIETLTGGVDTVFASVGHELDDNVENLTLTGTSSIAGTGNALANTITGNTGSNVIDGGAGADSMTGGDGNDTYYVDVVGDVIIEGNGLDSGTDTVRSTISYDITGTNLDNITLMGTTAINATGNGADNKLNGNSAANTLTGGMGNDTLDGNAGADAMIGESGDDIYYLDNAGDTVTETLNNGTDKIISSVTHALGGHSENLTLTGTAAVNGTGNSKANIIIGNSGDNTLTAHSGNDTIDGGRGADTMIGGLGNDTYAVDNVGDTVTEAAGGGIDKVTSTVSFTLTTEVDNLTLAGSSAIFGTGNAIDNIIIGSSANNTLVGNGGNDTLDGGSGSDSLDGGAGDDIYVMDVSTDSIIETAGNGIDLVKVGFNNYTLGSDLENLTLTSTAAVTGTGNAGDNIITGSSTANTLHGLAGNDTIIGGFGADAMHGGADNDTYTVDNSGDTVVELLGEGTDSVISNVNTTLSSNVENLTLTGTIGISGTGNDLANSIVGNSGSNTLKGLDGADTISGGSGLDRIYGGAGQDDLYGGALSDTFYFDTVSSSNITDGVDVIYDFTTGDKIHLTLLDANTGLAGNQNFIMDTDGLIAAGEVNIQDLTAVPGYGAGWYGVNISDDADSVIDMQIVVFSNHALTAADFIL